MSSLAPPSTTAPATAPRRDRSSGILLIASAAACAFLMMHHPDGIHGGTPTESLARSSEMAGLTRHVHVGLIVALFAQLVGHIGLAVAVGLQRPVARFGLIAYAAGAAAMGLAGILNGLAFPATAERFVGADPEDARIVHIVLDHAFELNQALSAVAAVLMALGVAALSLAMVLVRGAWRNVALLGLAIGTACAVAVGTGGVPMDARGVAMVMTGLAGWSAVAGVLLARRASTVE